MAVDDTPGSGGWWLLKLGRQIRDRRKTLDLWRDYYKGDAPLPLPPKPDQDQKFRWFQERARTNFCATVVNASVNRLEAIGVALGDGNPDDEAWSWWRRNKIASKQKQIYRLALYQSVGYVSVGAHPRDPSMPLIVPEHPRQVITHEDPATGETEAGLRVWIDETTGYARAIVATRETISRFRSKNIVGSKRIPWGKDSWEPYNEDPERRPAEQRNARRRVPFVPFARLPELGEDPEPEFGGVTEIQDRINLGILNRMTAERYSAWKQKHVTGHQFEKRKNSDGSPQIDPITGLEMVVNPFVPGPDTVWASEGENVRFGEFSQIDVTGFLRSHDADILDLLTISQTSPTTYMSDLVNIATDTVSLLDANHVAKVNEHINNFSAQWEEVLLQGDLVAGNDPVEDRKMRWHDPRQINPAVIADAAVKKHSMGYPLGVLAEDMGEAPERIRRITSQAAGGQMLQRALAGGGGGEQLPLPDVDE